MCSSDLFNAEYTDLIAMAVRRRNEGVSDQAFGQELAERFQNIMRGKLKFGAGASMPTIDRLAANEASLFHALGTEGAAFCLKMLGKDDTPAAEAPPDSVRRLMQLGTLYRFQAIVEGMAGKPLFCAGDVLFIGREIRELETFIGKEAVVQIKDGPRLVRRVLHGTRRGRYHLLGISDATPPLEDQAIAAAAHIEWVRRAR